MVTCCQIQNRDAARLANEHFPIANTPITKITNLSVDEQADNQDYNSGYYKIWSFNPLRPREKVVDNSSYKQTCCKTKQERHHLHVFSETINKLSNLFWPYEIGH